MTRLNVRCRTTNQNWLDVIRRDRQHSGAWEKINNMKRCTYCGAEYPDDAEVCVTDGYRLPEPPGVEKIAPPIIESEVRLKKDTSAEEQKVWDKMTFQRFAILFIRIEALWLLLYVIFDSTYLVRNFIKLVQSSHYMAEQIRIDIFWEMLRILLHVAAAVFLIQKAEKILSWLVKDWVAEESKKKD